MIKIDHVLGQSVVAQSCISVSILWLSPSVVFERGNVPLAAQSVPEQETGGSLQVLVLVWL